jgi:hypothetical protein
VRNLIIKIAQRIVNPLWSSCLTIIQRVYFLLVLDWPMSIATKERTVSRNDSYNQPIGDQPPLPEERREPPKRPERPQGEPPPNREPDLPSPEDEPPMGDPQPHKLPIGDPPRHDQIGG